MPFAIPISSPSSSSGSSTQSWTKVAKTYTNFSVADVTSKITLMTLPANTVIKHILINVTTVFNDGLANTATVTSLGVTGSDAYLFPTINSQPPLNALGQLNAQGNNSGQTSEFLATHNNGALEYSGVILYSTTLTTPITITLSASVNFNTFIQGAFTTYILTDTLPA